MSAFRLSAVLFWFVFFLHYISCIETVPYHLLKLQYASSQTL